MAFRWPFLYLYMTIYGLPMALFRLRYRSIMIPISKRNRAFVTFRDSGADESSRIGLGRPSGGGREKDMPKIEGCLQPFAHF